MPAHSRPLVVSEIVEETRAPHTRLLRVSLEVEHARTYWQRADPSRPREREVEIAFGEYWFGAKSMARVGALTLAFSTRFDPFPHAIEALRLWTAAERSTRTTICHWHLQLTDPIYRAFTGTYLPERRASGRREISREPVVRWVGEFDRENRWSAATRVGFASKLLSAASRAGLVEGTRDPRPLITPRVSPVALGYLLYLLRSVRFAGTLQDNPYLRSIGLEGGLVDDTMRQVPGLTYRRIGDLIDVTWDHENLVAWVRTVEATSP